MINYLAGKKIETTVRVLAVTVDALPMDGEDGDRVHLWLSCESWSTRRAFLAGGDDFLRSYLGAKGYTSAQIEQLRSARGTGALRSLADTMTGKTFEVVLVCPPDGAAPGERIEITAIRLHEADPVVIELVRV
jgi:hypothetical protein